MRIVDHSAGQHPGDADRASQLSGVLAQRAGRQTHHAEDDIDEGNEEQEHPKGRRAGEDAAADVDVELADVEAGADEGRGMTSVLEQAASTRLSSAPVQCFPRATHCRRRPALLVGRRAHGATFGLVVRLRADLGHAQSGAFERDRKEPEYRRVRAVRPPSADRERPAVMQRDGIELALTPDTRWNMDTEVIVAAARDAGFTALGLTEARANPAAKAAYEAADLRCHELLVLVVSADPPATIAAAERLAQSAGVVGEEWILTIVEPVLDSATAGILRHCAAVFAEVGAKMAIEFYPLSPINSVRTGLEAVAAAGPDRASLLIDTSHFCCGVSTWEDLAAVPLEQIAYVQFTDVLTPKEDRTTKPALPPRAFPGDGVLDLSRFAQTLRDRGWSGTVSVEIMNRTSRDLPVDEFARLAATAAAPFWT